ncbi:MAG: hypothetical protein SOT60_04375, partial [Bilifractor sp.]|nr:hypothetical protein [Bilifractor sp.]
MKRKMVVAALALSIAMSAVNVQAADLDLGSAPGSTGLDITILGTGNPADSGNSSGAGNESETAISEAELYPEGTPEEAKPARLASARLLLGSVGLFDYYHSYDAISAIFQSQYASYTTPGAYGDA